MSNEQATDFNLDALLDGTLDDLADLKEFKPFPIGTHLCQMTFERKTVNKHPGYEAKFKLVEHVELASGQEKMEPGAEASILYFLDNEIGQGQFKKWLATASEKFGEMSNRELADQFKNLEVLIVTKHRQNKDKTQTYMEVVEHKIV